MKKFEIIINKILKNSQLSQSESDYISQGVLEEKFDEYQIVSLLSFLFKKGESFEEIYAFLKILRKKMS